jgi:hypothetical protein
MDTDARIASEKYTAIHSKDTDCVEDTAESGIYRKHFLSKGAITVGTIQVFSINLGRKSLEEYPKKPLMYDDTEPLF